MKNMNEQIKISRLTNTNTLVIAFFCLIFGLISFIIRFYLNFSQELIPGVNGGYYPLQVRTLLAFGYLGFSDMPLLFYLNAMIIKIISLFGFAITDALILHVVKFTDSISIPLIVFPLFKMIRINTMSLPKSISLSIIGFSILSFNPLLLNSDLQKNSLAILFLMGFIAFASSFQQNKKRISIFLSTLFLILTGLTHFGTFSFALFYLFLTMVFLYRKKAVIPVLLIFTLGIMLIGIFDSSRFFRIFTFGLELFDKPALIYGALMPPDFILVLFSYILAVIGIITLRKKGGLMSNNQKAVLFSSIVCLLVLSFPLFGSEYFKRLSLFLFIPQIILMLTLAQFLKLGTLKTMAITFLTITLLSVLAIFGHPKEVVIDHEAYLNLKNLNSIISSDDKTIVIARHGLEWWTAWALKTKVAQDKAVDYNLLMNYNNIYFLNQKKGFNSGHERTLFHEPTFPENAGLIYSSDYFNVYKWKK